MPKDKLANIVVSGNDISIAFVLTLENIDHVYKKIIL